MKMGDTIYGGLGFGGAAIVAAVFCQMLAMPDSKPNPDRVALLKDWANKDRLE